jgi:hypothetical protein
MPIFGECCVRLRVRERVFGSVSGHHHLVFYNQYFTLYIASRRDERPSPGQSPEHHRRTLTLVKSGGHEAAGSGIDRRQVTIHHNDYWMSNIAGLGVFRCRRELASKRAQLSPIEGYIPDWRSSARNSGILRALYIEGSTSDQMIERRMTQFR